MDYIKKAFDNVKFDFSLLKEEIKNVKKELNEIQNSILSLNLKLSNAKDFSTKTHSSTHSLFKKTHPLINSTHSNNSTHSSTHNYQFKPFKNQKIPFSTGNNGVSTDRQTDTSTDRQTGFNVKNQKNTINNDKNQLQNQLDPRLVLNQLDSLKKDLRLKIKKLTKQEMIVYSAIYQFEDQGYIVDYVILSNNLNLSESSIRDYIQRIISKGLPLEKEKVNNKRIIIKIPNELRKLATLDTLITLRNL